MCDLAKEMESISHKNRTTQVKATSQLTLLQADQLSQTSVTLPNSTLTSPSSAPSAENLRMHSVSVLTTSTNLTTENGDENYHQIAEPKVSFDESSDSIVRKLLSNVFELKCAQFQETKENIFALPYLMSRNFHNQKDHEDEVFL